MWKWLVASSLVAGCEFPRPIDVGPSSATIGGEVHGMWDGSSELALRLTVRDVETLLSVTKDGLFAFPSAVDAGAAYEVSVASSPMMHTCVVVAGNMGVVGDGDLASVEVACTGPAVSVGLSAPQPWRFDPTRARQPALIASLLLQEVTVTVDSTDSAVQSARVAGEDVMLGKPSAVQPLALGINTLEIEVVARGQLRKVYQVVLDRGESSIEQRAYTKASNSGASDQFGYSVALSGDTLAVGAFHEASSATGVDGDQSNNDVTGAGAVYVFRRTGTAWTQEAYIKSFGATIGENFGWSVALCDGTLAVGAPGAVSGRGTVYMFRRIGTAWLPEGAAIPTNTQPGERFGTAVALSGLSGNTLVVGAPSYPAANGDIVGAAYVFQRTSIIAAPWAQQAFVPSPNSQRDGAFGASVSLSGDTFVVGARGEFVGTGAAYVFQRTGPTWVSQVRLTASNATILAQFGTAVALSGDTLAVSAPTEFSAATGVNGDQTDRSAVEAGAVYVFQRSGFNWIQQAYIKASNTEQLDTFGWSVALSGDLLVAGAVAEDSAATAVNGAQGNNGAMDSGAVYVFQRTGSTWSQRAYLKASNTEGSDYFGRSVAISGGIVAVGAEGEDGGETGVNRNQLDNRATSAGAVYLFQ